MTRLKGSKGSFPWLWLALLVIVLILTLLVLDYFDIVQLGLY